METSSIISLSIVVGAIIFLIAQVFFNWKKGGNAAAKEVIDLREAQVKALKDEISRLTNERREDHEKFSGEIKSLTGKVGELSGQLTARDGEIKRLTELITNRNPEMDNFFKECVIAIKESRTYYTTTVPVLEEMGNFTKQVIPLLTRMTNVLDKVERHLGEDHQAHV